MLPHQPLPAQKAAGLKADKIGISYISHCIVALLKCVMRVGLETMKNTK